MHAKELFQIWNIVPVEKLFPLENVVVGRMFCVVVLESVVTGICTVKLAKCFKSNKDFNESCVT
jgi:hypothetical protein